MEKQNKPDYLKVLNEQQYEAATHTEGPMLILAGAGSGKTSTMTRRIAYMILEKGIPPYNILAVTFTNKAAKEMRDRVEQLVGEDTRMWLLTFHSTCLRILQRNAEKAGYHENLTVYDPVDQKAVIKKCIKAANVNEKVFTPKMVLARISDAKEKGESSSEFSMSAASPKERTIADLYQRYERELKNNNAVDFDDMIWRVVDMFDEYPEVLELYRRRFRYIMVDEYQDTNYMQYRFVKALAGESRNLCVVGDDDQCIYEWRGADIANILSFEKDFPGCKVIKLEQNYRSSGNILKAAHSVISHNRQRKAKKLWTSAEEGSRITYKRFQNEKEEASWIAEQIDGYVLDEGRRYKNFAVLYRTNAQSRSFEEAMIARSIPYVVRGTLRFYDRKEIKDMIAYMRLVVNPDDNVAFLRVINEPKRSIGPRTIEKIAILAEQQETSMLRLLTDEEVVGGFTAKAAEGLRSFVRLIAECRAGMSELSVSDLYDRLFEGSGYLGMLEKEQTTEAEGRLENLMEFKSAIADREEENPEMTLAEFLENLSLDAEVDQGNAKTDDKVVLMTLHGAKGLEYPVVFMPGMEDGLFPGWRSLDSEEGISEERRLCYVGITRAKEKLYLTSAKTRTLYGRTEYTQESQFLKEMDNSLLDEQSDEPGKSSYPTRRDGYASEVRYSDSHRPFDPIRAQADIIKKKSRDIQRKKISAANQYEIGMRVRHSKFGDGLVIEVSDAIVKVAFDKVGIKKLAVGIAPLEVII